MMGPFAKLAAGVLAGSAVLTAAVAAGREAKTPEGGLVQNSRSGQMNGHGLPGFDDAVAHTIATLEAGPGRVAVRRWTPRTEGSFRIVGYLRKPSSETEAEVRVLVDGKAIWRRRLERSDSIRHAFDVVAYELTERSAVELQVLAGKRSRRVQVEAAYQIVPEPFVSRWRPDLPTGFPAFTEADKVALRKKGQDILQRIRDASAAGRARVAIPPGDYLFHANWHRASTLKGIADLEIDARGVTFWFEPPHVNALFFKNCRNVIVRGLEIDFTSPIWFQARVAEVDRQKKTVQATLMDGYAPRDAKGKPETSGARALVFYDSEGCFVNHGPSPGKWRLSDNGAGVLCREIRRHGIPGALSPGGYVVGTIRTGAALRLSDCARMRFEDVNIWSSPGVAINNHLGEGGHVYRRVRATRRPRTNRLHAFGADVFHFAQQDRGPVLDRCESAYSADDNINIHGAFGRVVKQAGRRRYYLQGAYEVGDTLEFRDMRSVELLGMARVVSVRKTPDGPSLAINEKYKAKGEVLVELDKPLELAALSLVVLDGKRSCQGWVIRNCWFHDNFQRTLINGSPGGLIENTTLQNVGMGICIQFETWGPWMEGPFARDLVIRNSRFLDSPPDGPAISVSMHPPGGGSNRRRFEAKPVTNLTIAGNYFARTGGAPLSVHNVDGLTIRGNSIDRASDDSLSSTDVPDWLCLQDCDNVSIRENQTPGLPDKARSDR